MAGNYIYSSTVAGYLWMSACTCGGSFLPCKALMLHERMTKGKKKHTAG